MLGTNQNQRRENADGLQQYTIPADKVSVILIFFLFATVIRAIRVWRIR